MNSKTALAIAIVAAIATAPAYAKPKPIKGKYRCSGNRSLGLSSGWFTTGTKVYPIGAKMAVVRHQYAIDILTSRHEVRLDGYFPQQYSPTFKLGFGPSLSTNKGREAGCLIKEMYARGTGTQNKSGRKVSLDINLEYFCLGSTTLYTDRYQLNCKR